MMKSLTRLLSEILHLPGDALVYELSRRLAERHDPLFVLETEDGDFDPFGYAEAGGCALYVLEHTHAQIDLEWHGPEKGVRPRPKTALMEVHWRGQRLYLLKVTVDDGGGWRCHLLTERPEVAHDFFAAVCLWGDRAEGTVLVYQQGGWRRDDDLLKEIARADMDALVLPPNVKEALLQDVDSFFVSADLYDRYELAWKRGVLLLGPPGNGKTHAIKALVRRLGVPCLYVRSFRSDRGTVQGNIHRVFERARHSAPCLLVLEDLDSLLPKDSLSFFLNELDGFRTNRGVLTLATTNHPERLDPALLERPSRFDRKVTFDLPGETERARFLTFANARFQPEMQATPNEIEALARETEGFSFAFLKELTISGMVLWMRDQAPGSMGRWLGECVASLRAQITAPNPGPSQEDEEEE